MTWKQAKIIPLSKVSKPSSLSDTRPIANLPHFAKVMDKIIADQMTKYFESNALLSMYQSGFRKNYNTQSVLIKITDDIPRGIENGLVTILLLFDFRKAFDSISHYELLIILRSLNFSNEAIILIFNYLSGRSQGVVDLDNVISEFLPIFSGVPQGSTPGPIIFIIFINSLIDVLFHSKLTLDVYCRRFANIHPM